MREQIIWLAGKRHVCSGAALAQASAAGAPTRMRQRRPFAWCAASISVRDSALVIPMEIVVADVRDLAVALVGRAVDSVVFGLAAVAPHLLGGKAAHFAFISSKSGG